MAPRRLMVPHPCAARLVRGEVGGDGGWGVDLDDGGGCWSSDDALCARPGEELCLLRDEVEEEAAEGRGVWTKADEAGRREGRRKRGSRRGRRPRMAGCCKGVIEPLHDLLLRLPLLLLVHGRLSAASCASVVWVGDRALGVRASRVLLLQ
jgi:hypothetical protein